MDYIFDKFTEWIKNLLVNGIMNNLSGLFDNVNTKVQEISTQVGSTPQAWNSNIFNMIKNLSDNVILPIAGVILAIVMTLELIQLITDRNNLHDVDTWMFFKWIFKTACAVLIVSHTWDLVMGVFDVAQSVISRSSGIITGTLNIDIASHFADLETRLQAMGVGELLGLWLQSFIVGITMWALSICIFIIAYGRMIEIYLVSSVAPITEVINACDAGREGELIFRTVYNLAGCKKPMKRLWISSMEDTAIKDGFNNLRPGSEYDNLYLAALCRSKADWLVGINATRLFSVLYHRTLNVGRVVSPTLAMIVQREADMTESYPLIRLHCADIYQ